MENLDSYLHNKKDEINKIVLQDNFLNEDELNKSLEEQEEENKVMLQNIEEKIPPEIFFNWQQQRQEI